MPEPAYPDVTIYATRDPSGQLEPIAVSVGGFALPVLAASLGADPNGRTHGTRAMTATITFPIGGGGICEVGSEADIPELGSFVVSEEV